MKNIAIIVLLALSISSFGQRKIESGTINMTLSKDSVFQIFNNKTMVGSFGSMEIKCNDLTTDAYIIIGVGVDTARQAFGASSYDTINLDRGKIVIQWPTWAPITSGELYMLVKHGTEATATLRNTYYFKKE